MLNNLLTNAVNKMSNKRPKIGLVLMHKGSCSIILPYEIAPKKFFGLVEKLLQTLPTFLTCLALSSVLDIRCSMGQNDRMTSKHIFSLVLTNSFYWIFFLPSKEKMENICLENTLFLQGNQNQASYKLENMHF